MGFYSPLDADKKVAYMKEVFAECGEDSFIEGPFYATWGGKNVHFGNGIYANYNLTLLDDGHIYVGSRDERIDRENLNDICERKSKLPKFK